MSSNTFDTTDEFSVCRGSLIELRQRLIRIHDDYVYESCDNARNARSLAVYGAGWLRKGNEFSHIQRELRAKYNQLFRQTVLELAPVINNGVHSPPLIKTHDIHQICDEDSSAPLFRYSVRAPYTNYYYVCHLESEAEQFELISAIIEALEKFPRSVINFSISEYPEGKL